MTATDRVIRWSTALAVVGVAAVAAVVSYEHASALVRAHGEGGWTARLIPLTVDGLIYASSMVMLDSARRGVPVPVLARWLLGLGVAATLAANVAHGLGHGPVGAAVAAWPAVALVGSYELLMMVIRSSQTASDGVPDNERASDPLREQAAEVFAEQLAADRVPSVRAIRASLHVGQPRAQRLRDYLAAGANEHREDLLPSGRTIRRAPQSWPAGAYVRLGSETRGAQRGRGQGSAAADRPSVCRGLLPFLGWRAYEWAPAAVPSPPRSSGPATSPVS
jgi:hypothetical protein